MTYLNGTFVRAEISKGEVIGIIYDGKRIIHYEGGFPFGLSHEVPILGTVNSIAAQAYFISLAKRLKRESEDVTNPLHRAYIARGQQHVEWAVKLIDKRRNSAGSLLAFEDDSNNFQEDSAPKTGVYCVTAMYAGGYGYGEHFDAIRISPRISEGALEIVLGEIAPNGFGNIPKEIVESHTESLARYYVREVPDFALDLVDHSLTINMI